MIGLGPTGISFAGSGQTALKVINPDSASGYIEAVSRGGATCWDRAFAYAPRDLRIFHLTRVLAALRIDRHKYQNFSSSDPFHDFPQEFKALEREGLMHVSDDTIEPTGIGMFYADSIAGLLSWNQVQNFRNRQGQREAPNAGLANSNTLSHI
ncbi:hypothetical protein V5E97_27220 [Singulisphaera sp. Ch08]|uniref:HemN C-terminal domain-containing protein n=1 Tax=Singulisphaera sp. Ch08 TaxID=3120278 RepID=A0AAU7CA43_9BACT